MPGLPLAIPSQRRPEKVCRGILVSWLGTRLLMQIPFSATPPCAKEVKLEADNKDMVADLNVVPQIVEI